MNDLNILQNGIFHEIQKELEKLQTWMVTHFKSNTILEALYETFCYLKLITCSTILRINTSKQSDSLASAAYQKYFKMLFKLSKGVSVVNSNYTDTCPKELDNIPISKTMCLNSWCIIKDYIHYWQQGTYKYWCSIIDCLRPTENSNPNTTSLVIGSTTSLDSNWYLKILGMDLDKVCVLLVSGLVMSLLYIRYVHTRQRNNGKSGTEGENNYAQLIQLINTLRKDQEQFKLEVKDRIQTLTIRIKKLEEDMQLVESRFTQQSTNSTSINKDFILYSKINNLQNCFQEHSVLLQGHKAGLRKIQEEIKTLDEKFTLSQERSEPQNDTFVSQMLKNIDNINKKTHQLELRIEELIGTKQDKDYLNIHELLIRNSISLDNIESRNIEIIRTKRREAVRYVNVCFNLLEDKVRQK